MQEKKEEKRKSASQKEIQEFLRAEELKKQNPDYRRKWQLAKYGLC